MNLVCSKQYSEVQTISIVHDSQSNQAQLTVLSPETIFVFMKTIEKRVKERFRDYLAEFPWFRDDLAQIWGKHLYLFFYRADWHSTTK